MDISAQRIFVTGGTRGIGLELVKALGARGARVATCGRSREGLASAQEQLPGLATFACDLSDIDGLPALVQRLRQDFGAPTVLINNAGIQLNPSWLDTPVEGLIDGLRREIVVNLTSPMVLTALLLEDLRRADEAAIVNLSSLLALAPKRSAPIYCATKAAVRSFTRALRYQLEGEPRVHVVEVIPPLVDTGMTAGRGSGKISPAQAASEIVSGLAEGRDEIHVGKAKAMRWIHRLAPGAAARLLRDG